MNLKNQIRLYLDLRGMTAAELARKCKLPKQRISDLLAGIPPRKLESLKEVADVLGVSLDHLCFGAGAEKSPQKVIDIDSILGDGWVSGVFEVRFRRVKR
jgi:transcriptional regulator with XRE-family HTH domain